MRALDLIVLAAFLVYIVWDGVRRGRETRDAEGYLLAGRKMRWWAMGLSVMATQASAITLISTTGQGFADGMRFLHFYLAIPFAMVILCATVVPWFHRARVVTAYEWLEQRFDRTTRRLASVFFLVSRSLAVGSVMYAPSVVLARGVGIPQWQSILAMGVLATIYTAIGGNLAVIVTDAKQMVVMFAGLIACVAVAWHGLPHDVGFVDALRIAGATNRLDTFRIPTTFAQVLSDKYTLVSGLCGGLFLFLGYFGADQEQVQRYLAGSSVEQSRKSLLVSAFAKVPMQFVILLLGVLIWVHYSFAPSPAFFRAPELERRLASESKSAAAPLRAKLDRLKERTTIAAKERESAARAFLLADAAHAGAASGDVAPAGALSVTRDQAIAELRRADAVVTQSRSDGMALLREAGLAKPGENNDADYVFTHFLVTDVPVGLAGLVLAAIFAAAISSLVSPLNSLATSAVWDLWVPTRKRPPTQEEIVRASKIATFVWGGFATIAAFSMGDRPIIEQVNRIGSFFYGSMFGVFVLGRTIPRARGRVGAVALVGGLATVLSFHYAYNEYGVPAHGWPRIEFLWYNPIGFFAVMAIGFVASRFQRPQPA